jgi:hypothetical protein
MSDADYRWLDREVAKVDPVPPPPPPETDPEATIKEACRTHRLVLVRDSRWCLAYWDGQVVYLEWEKHHMLWDLLWKLAEAARVGRSAPWDELHGCDDPKTAVTAAAG